MKRVVVITGASGLADLATGLVVVPPGEVVVVRRLGKVLPRPWAPRLHGDGPAGFDRAVRVRTDEVGRADVPGPEDDPGARENQTNDRKVICDK